jgi:hypothetical protein
MMDAESEMMDEMMLAAETGLETRSQRNGSKAGAMVRG